MHRGVFIAAVVACVTVVGALHWIAFSPPKPALPPLLEGATAAGGWFGACPPRDEAESARRSRLPAALSPKLNKRLNERFPRGSPEKSLVRFLTEQGFRIRSPCKNDATVRVANFQQHPGGLFSYPMTAKIFWKADSGKIIWTKGFVAFSGF